MYLRNVGMFLLLLLYDVYACGTIGTGFTVTKTQGMGLNVPLFYAILTVWRCKDMRELEQSVRKAYEKLTKLLIRKGLTITTMESATAGQIASLLTDTEGSSAILKGAFITYSNEAKIRQGVPADVIEKYSVYSEETAAAMAEACRSAYNADIGIGVTGTMGNVDPANPESSVPGQLYFAIADKDGCRTFFRNLPAQETRLAWKLAAAGEVCAELFALLG